MFKSVASRVRAFESNPSQPLVGMSLPLTNCHQAINTGSTLQQAVKLELSMSEEKCASLRHEMDELTLGSGGGASDEDVAALRRSRLELQRRCADQEDEMDDLAGQVSMLEQAKLRLEMSIEQMRKEYRLELAQKDDETEELRANVSKKIKALESQLEMEHDERTTLLRDKHDLERRIIALSSSSVSLSSCSETSAQLPRLRRELKQCRALLRDTQLQLERARTDTASRVQLRQLKHQLEDAEFSASAAARGRQTAESELHDCQQQLQQAQRARADAETRCITAGHQLHQLQSHVDEQEHELQEVMRKYKISVSQLSSDQLKLSDQCNQLSALESERNQLKDQLNELSSKLQQLSEETGSREQQLRLELRERELQSRLDYETAARHRLECQLARNKESLERVTLEADNQRHSQQATVDQLNKLQRQFRDLKEELCDSERRESDLSAQLRSLSKQLEESEAESAQHRSDLKLALKRITDLQSAIQGEIESGDDSYDLSDDTDSDDDDDFDAINNDEEDIFLSAHLPSSCHASSATVPTTANIGTNHQEKETRAPDRPVRQDTESRPAQNAIS